MGSKRRDGRNLKKPRTPSAVHPVVQAGLEECALSVCIIARNEARHLPACLRSLEPLHADVVVVDTGSDDGTPELAQVLGARVYHQPWRDDFSAPRNLAAEHALGRFLLLLDADERLTPEGCVALRAALSDDDFDCGLLPLSNASRAGASTEEVVSGHATLGDPQLLPRVFRNSDDLRWEGLVHERPSAWFARSERRLRTLSAVPIAHYGAVPSLRKALHKEDRNLRLLEKQCALTPHDARIREYLAYALRDAGQLERATAEIARAFADLKRELSASAPGPRPSIVTAATLHAHLLRDGGELASALSVLEEAVALSGGTQDAQHPNLHFQIGVCHELLALRHPQGERSEQHLCAAQRAYELCLLQKGVLFAAAINPPGSVDGLSHKRLGMLALMRGDAQGAERALRTVLDRMPQDEEACLGLAEAAVLRGDLKACLRQVKPFLSKSIPDALTLAAMSCEQGGDLATSKNLALQALRLFKHTPFLAPHRRPLLAELCKRLSAAA